ncbi:hypothetical protein [Phormidesmis priestleyi]
MGRQFYFIFNFAYLLSRFKEIHLVDLDEQAVHDGILRQGLNDTNNIFVHGTIDLTGSLPFLCKLHQELELTEGEAKDFIQEAILPLKLNINEPFEIVASICILTQLIDTVIGALGNTHPYLFDFILKIRNHHLSQLISLVEPGGWGFLITDVVSSDSFTEMANISEENFLEIMKHLIANQNFFHGVNPYRINSVLSSNLLASTAQILHVWRWNFGSRIYAVYGIGVQKKTLSEIIAIKI